MGPVHPERRQRLETGRPPLPIRLQRALVDQVLAAAVVDIPVATAFNEVAFMNAHPSTLGAPSVVLRSVFSNVRTFHAARRRRDRHLAADA